MQAGCQQNAAPGVGLKMPHLVQGIREIRLIERHPCRNSGLWLLCCSWSATQPQGRNQIGIQGRQTTGEPPQRGVGAPSSKVRQIPVTPAPQFPFKLPLPLPRGMRNSGLRLSTVLAASRR